MRRRLALFAMLAMAIPGVAWADQPGAAEVPLDPGLAPYSAGPAVAGHIVGTTGMDSVEQMFNAWAAAFRAHHPGADLSIVQAAVAPEERIALGSGTGEVFHPGDDVYEDKYGYEPFRIRVCQGAFVLKSHVSAIGVFVSKANPIDHIALAKLDAIFSDERRRGYPAAITTWGQLGLTGEWADKPIHPIGFYWRDDVTWYFRNIVSLGAPFGAAYRVPGDDLARRTPAVADAIMTTLARDPYSIGFANFSYENGSAKALAIADDKDVLAAPVIGDMASGRYPLQRSIYIYVNRKPGTPLSPLIREFLSFVLSRDGQSLVSKDHYLPLTAAMAAAERAKLQ